MRTRNITRLFGVVSGLAFITAFAANAKAEAEPRLLKPTLNIMLTRYLRYFPTPTAKEPIYNTWSWRPRFSFTVEGPLISGSQLSIAFSKPDGTPWLNMPLDIKEIPEGQTVQVVSPNDTTQEAERHTSVATGTFSFKITLKNGLTNTNKTLYAGKFTVSKYPIVSNIPEYKNKAEFYVEHDWLLPIGYLFASGGPDEEAPKLRAAMWFRGDFKAEQVSAYLFYKGKPISSTANPEQGSSYAPFTLQTPATLPDPKWMDFVFSFHRVALYNKMTSANNYTGTHFLDKNPGEYEIKVLVKGQLARVTSFTVGEDGKIVDNGIAAKNGMAGLSMILPLKIVPGGDVKAAPTSYKTDAYYGNPLAGFVIP